MNQKTFKFNSDRLEKFIVLEERRDNIRLFPHTQQLEKLHQALDREFRAPLSQCISRVGKYSDDYWKILLWLSGNAFCHFINSGRPDRLRLCCLPGQDRVARITIVQQITEHTPLGACHRFKFYGGEDFFQEIYLSGKRLVFSNHALERFTQRAENILVEELSAFIDMFPGNTSSRSMKKVYTRPMGHLMIIARSNGDLKLVEDGDVRGLFWTEELHVNSMLTTNLNVCAKHFPNNLKFDSFAAIKSRHRIKAIVEHAKNLLAVDAEKFFKPQSSAPISKMLGVTNATLFQ